MTKRRTSTNFGHSHSYDDKENGQTSLDDKHDHQFVVYINSLVPEDKKVVIMPKDGHFHLPANANKEADNLKDDEKDLKWLDVPFKIKAMKQDDNFFYFTGYASTFGNVDLGGDIVVKGAFSTSLMLRMPKLIEQHEVKKPLGILISAVEDEFGLLVEGKMPKNHTRANDMIIMMEMGAIDSMSIGYRIKDYEMKDDIMFLKVVDLWEVSLVTFAMQPAARVVAMKDKDGNKSIEEIFEGIKSLKELEEYLKEKGLSQTERKILISKTKQLIGLRDGDPHRDDGDRAEKLLNEVGQIIEILQ